eukprot:EC795299.1.p1 GENE.EC795299.1~~EC795299.1.p1  ORF type:complete len:186 (-),score=13.07 EC795299.1:26-583(-)
MVSTILPVTLHPVEANRASVSHPAKSRKETSLRCHLRPSTSHPAVRKQQTCTYACSSSRRLLLVSLLLAVAQILLQLMQLDSAGQRGVLHVVAVEVHGAEDSLGDLGEVGRVQAGGREALGRWRRPLPVALAFSSFSLLFSVSCTPTTRRFTSAECLNEFLLIRLPCSRDMSRHCVGSGRTRCSS